MGSEESKRSMEEKTVRSLSMKKQFSVLGFLEAEKIF